jgi:hypothetical protein
MVKSENSDFGICHSRIVFEVQVSVNSFVHQTNYVVHSLPNKMYPSLFIFWVGPSLDHALFCRVTFCIAHIFDLNY